MNIRGSQKKRAGLPVSPSEKKVYLPTNEYTVFTQSDLGMWYPPVMLNPMSLASLATSTGCLRQAMRIISRLEPDDYLRYLVAYYQAGLARFGDAWRYADIVTVLLASAQLTQPRRYLEIGVRRGRSMAMVAATCPSCELVGFDLWTPDYAGMPNPGPDFVRVEMQKAGHTGLLDLIGGDSHTTVPHYLQMHPNQFFDLITVDGDHSALGAEQDLRAVLPRLTVGGVIVFDDISHPMHLYLADVWQRVVVSDKRFAPWQFTEIGYGVAFAVRMDS
jgi:predicted O-methyltransferase YrrM